MRLNIIYKQGILFRTKASVILWSGTRGSAKSSGGLIYISSQLSKVAGSTCLWLRRTYRALEDIRKQFQEFQPYFGYTILKDEIRFPNGSRILLNQCRDEQDALKFQGYNIEYLVIDEAAQFPKSIVQLLYAVVRTTKDILTQVILMSNPGGGKGKWLRTEFVNHAKTKGTLIEKDWYEWTDDDGVKKAWIHSTFWENPFLQNKEGYARQLVFDDPSMTAAWRDGSWDAVAGNFFPTLKQHLGVLDFKPISNTGFVHGKGMITTWQYPRFFISIDSGWANATAVLFAVYVPWTKQVHVFDELCFTKTTASDVAKAIKAKLSSYGITSYVGVIDKATKQHTPAAQESIYDLYAVAGIHAEPSNSNRETGYRIMREWFTLNSVSGQPNLLINGAKCPTLISELENLESDALNLEVAADQGDGTDFVDALRYLLVKIVYTLRGNSANGTPNKEEEN